MSCAAKGCAASNSSCTSAESDALAVFVLVEGHGEVDAVSNLLARLVADLGLALALAKPIRAPGMTKDETLKRYAELVRAKPNVDGLVVLRDDEDGCPKTDGPRLADLLRSLNLPFPCAVVLAYREYESLFLPCVQQIAGKALTGVHGMTRPGLRADARFDGDYEAKRGVKEWLSSQMAEGKAYKPTMDQLPMTRMVDFAVVRASGLPWFGSLERALKYLADVQGKAGVAYPSQPSGRQKA